MRPATKKPTDNFDKYPKEPPHNDPSLTRQEFAQEADINVIIEKFGGDALTRPPTWGQEIDYDLDLTTALHASAALKDAWQSLPQEMRDRYRNWDEINTAIARGELDDKGNIVTDPKPEPEPKPSTGGDTGNEQ